MRSAFDRGEPCDAMFALAEESGAASLRERSAAGTSRICRGGSRRRPTMCRARIHAQPRLDGWQACTETLARISLAQNRLDDCFALCSTDIDRSVPADDDHAGYAYRHTS